MEIDTTVQLASYGMNGEKLDSQVRERSNK